MKNITAGKVVGGSNLCLPGRFREALPLYHPSAIQTKLHTGVGMDAVVNASVVGHIAAGHAGIGSIDNGIAGKGGDVSLPEVDARLHLR